MTSIHPTPASGPHVLITGAARGIGAAIAQALAADGAQITLLGRHAATLQSTCDALPGLGHGFVVADISDPQTVNPAFATARAARGPIAVLINNAGQAESAPLLKTSLDLWHKMLAVNLTGTFICSQAALPDMLAKGQGRIINIASTAAQRGYAYVSAYVAAKHGVLGLTRALALEMAQKGITVNAICPGYTETDLLEESIARVVAKTGRSAEAARAEFASGNPQKRLIQPEEIAATVRWLCSPQAASITGQAISVSGGEVM